MHESNEQLMTLFHFLSIDNKPVVKNDDGFDGNFILFLCILLVGIVYFQYSKRFSLLYNQFSSKSRFSKQKLLEAYLFLGAHLIKQDAVHAGKKIVFMNNYFNRYFPDENYDFSAELSDSYSNEIPHLKIATWLNVHLDKAQKLQAFYFATGLSMIDGLIVPNEIKALSEIADVLEISPKEVQSILGMHKQQKEQKYTKTASIPRKSKAKLASEIIGVSEHADMSEVKKAYRKLVKLHHPDRFFNESEAQQNIAEERFMEIQKAYEILEQFK